jgi:hypothetical protein
LLALHELNAVKLGVDELLDGIGRRAAADQRSGQPIECVDLRCVRLSHRLRS